MRFFSCFRYEAQERIHFAECVSDNMATKKMKVATPAETMDVFHKRMLSMKHWTRRD